jgi:hypothetical protein
MALRNRIAGALVLGTLALSLQGCGKKGGNYSTPQEVFDAFKTAGAKEDYKGQLDCLTDDSRNMLVGGAVLMISMVRDLAPQLGKGDEDKAKVKPLQDLLQKHGVKDELVKQVVGEVFGEALKKGSGKGAETMKKATRKLAEPIKDQVAFLTDAMAALQQANPQMATDEQEKRLAMKNAELHDLTISGDTAKGTLVTKKGGVENREPLHFRKVEGGWRVDLEEALLKKGGGR